jgi:hypothetical protein
MSDSAQNQLPNHPQPTRSVTVSISEWCFLLICIIQASSKQPRAKVMAAIVQQIIDTPGQSLKLGFAQQDYRSLTAALPIELYKVVYEQAARNAESDSQYISRLLEQALPTEIYTLVNNLIDELRKWSIALENEPGQGTNDNEDLPETRASNSATEKSSSDNDDLANFMAHHAQLPIVEDNNTPAIQTRANGQPHDQSTAGTETSN